MEGLGADALEPMFLEKCGFTGAIAMDVGYQGKTKLTATHWRYERL